MPTFSFFLGIIRRAFTFDNLLWLCAGVVDDLFAELNPSSLQEMPLCIEVIFRSIPIADQGSLGAKGPSSIRRGNWQRPSGDASGDGRGQKQARNRMQTMVFHIVPPASGACCPFGPRRSDVRKALNRQ